MSDNLAGRFFNAYGEPVSYTHLDVYKRQAAAVARYEREADRLGIVKFVPASGAATRMFKELFEFVNEGKRGKGIDTLLDLSLIHI